MTELELFKFIKDNKVDMRWDSDGGNEARITAMGYVWIDLLPICDYYGIEPENIQPK